MVRLSFGPALVAVRHRYNRFCHLDGLTGILEQSCDGVCSTLLTVESRAVRHKHRKIDLHSLAPRHSECRRRFQESGQPWESCWICLARTCE